MRGDAKSSLKMKTKKQANLTIVNLSSQNRTVNVVWETQRITGLG